MKRQGIVLLAGLLFIGSLSGCGVFFIRDGNSGIDDQTTLAKIQKGVTTEDQVGKILGAPDKKTIMTNGDELWSYHYTVANGASRKDEQLQVEFNSNQVVQRVVSNRTKKSLITGAKEE